MPSLSDISKKNSKKFKKKDYRSYNFEGESLSNKNEQQQTDSKPTAN